MSINLGTAACTAIHEIRGNPDFRILVEQIGEQVWKYALASMSAPVDQAAQQLGYAKALHDLWLAIIAEVNGVSQQQQRTRSAPVSAEKMARATHAT